VDARRLDDSPLERRRGLVIVQLDGVAEPTLRRALAERRMPVLARWLADGSHRLSGWRCGLPSQTSASQSGILYGRNVFPAFRFYDKERQRLFVSNQPTDAALMDRLASTGTGLLSFGGSSLANLLSGDAPRSALTMSTLGRTALGTTFSGDIYLYLFNPYIVWWMMVGAIREIVREVGQAWRAAAMNVRPRVPRGGSFPFLRAASNVVLRDLTVAMLRRELRTGVPLTYCTFVGYDVVGHHAGPEREEALAVLGELDVVLGHLEDAVADAPRDYEICVLSDHGQTHSTPFRQRFGETLESLVSTLVSGRPVASPKGREESWGYLNALLQEATQGQRRTARAARRFLRPRTVGGVVEVGPDRDRRRRARASAVVVCDSGNLALVYLSEEQGRLTLERINELQPALITGLAAHDGIGFVLVRSETRGPLVVGPRGIHHLADGRIDGEDPLADYGPGAADQLRELDAMPHVGDLVVNGCFDPRTQEAIGFEELVGSHGGLGGPQNEAMLVTPASWPETGDLDGAAAVHEVLMDGLRRLGLDRADEAAARAAL
jgi:hypothetical protein